MDCDSLSEDDETGSGVVMCQIMMTERNVYGVICWESSMEECCFGYGFFFCRVSDLDCDYICLVPSRFKMVYNQMVLEFEMAMIVMSSAASWYGKYAK